jgi:hypothetical protein
MFQHTLEFDFQYDGLGLGTLALVTDILVQSGASAQTALGLPAPALNR